jgi:adenylate kinase family enzyme
MNLTHKHSGPSQSLSYVSEEERSWRGLCGTQIQSKLGDCTMSLRIHIFGASGSGTTTLGMALSKRLDVLFLDADSYYWKATYPPFREKHPAADRINMIQHEIGDRDSWVLSGSICSWGDPIIHRFTLAVFLHLDPAIRMERILLRERMRYGTSVEPGGSMHEAHLDFMAWAASYDTAVAPTRSLELHERWMRQLKCPVLTLNAEASVENLLESVLAYRVA